MPLAYEMAQWNPAGLGSQGALVAVHCHMVRNQRIVDIRWWEKTVPGTAVVAQLHRVVSCFRQQRCSIIIHTRHEPEQLNHACNSAIEAVQYPVAERCDSDWLPWKRRLT